MNGPLALLFPAATSLDVHEIAVASLEAFLQRHAPSLPVMRLAVPTALPHPIELALYRAHPTLIVLWCPPEGIWALEPLLTRLRPLLPTSSIVLAGPAIATIADATRLLTRCPQVDAVIRGEPEQTLLELAMRPWPPESSTPETSRAWVGVQGLSLRTGGEIVHAPDRPLLPPDQLESPFAADILRIHRPRPRTVWLEVMRGALPFSPLPLWLQEGPPRPLPLERLEIDLRAVFDAEIPVVHFLSGPLDLVPGHLRSVLELSRTLNRSSLIELEVARLPDPDLAALMREAGVGRLTLEHPTDDTDSAEAGPLLDRARLKQLIDHQIQVTVRMPVGRPGERIEAVRRRIELYLMASVTRIELTPVRLWPGHPMRAGIDGPDARSPGETPRPPGSRRRHRAAPPRDVVRWQDLRVADAPWYEILGAPGISFETREALLAWAPILDAVVPIFPSTLRLLARASDRPLNALLSQLFQRDPGGPPRGWRELPIASRARRLMAFARWMLEQSGRPDRLPFIAHLCDYEQWVHTPSRPLPRVRSHPCPPGPLERCVLARLPGLELRTFPYDTLRLLSQLEVDDVKLHRTHLILRRRNAWPAITQPVTDLQRVLFEETDGSRTAGELIEALQKRPGPAAIDSMELERTLQGMIERQLLRVQEIRPEPGEEPQTSARRKILPFIRPGADRAESTGTSADEGDINRMDR